MRPARLVRQAEELDEQICRQLRNWLLRLEELAEQRLEPTERLARTKKTLAETKKTLAETKKTLAETKRTLAETLVKRAARLAKTERQEVDTWTWAQALAELVGVPLVTYGEVLANSKLKDIIYSIEPDHRLRFAHNLWSHRQKYWWLIQILVPITRLPQELLHQIFLIIIDNASDSPLVLMRVCKLWYTIVTGIWASLKLGTTTPKDTITGKLKRNQWFLDVVVDTEIDRGHFTPSKKAYEAIFAAMEAASRWRSLVLETFPAPADLPEKLVNRGLRQCTNSVMNRLRTFRIKFPCEMSPLLDHLLRVLGTSASEELTIVEINSAYVISFLVPTYSSIFRSVTVLSLDTPGLSNPVDLLPHLHQLESLTATHLPLPVYHNNDANLPFIHTLRHLRLRSVSIQWMSGRTFHVLETCTLTFPIHHHVLDTFCTTLPNCKALTFEGYPLDILNGIASSKLDHLSVMCSSSYKPRGNRQLARFSSQALRESRLAPRFLHISVEATSAAWIKALEFMSNLEELVIHNAEPSSLGVKVLRSLVVDPINAYELGITATPGGWNTPVCPSLKRFGLRYRRWLRPSEHFDLIPVFMSIIRSREQSNFSLHSFRIWTGINQKDPWELIEKSSISFQKIKHLRTMVSLKDGIINLPVPYDDLSALSPVIQSEFLNLLRLVRETKEVEDDEIDDIVRSMTGLSLDQIVCSSQDRNTFLGQIENARQPQPLCSPLLSALNEPIALPPTTSPAASTSSTLPSPQTLAATSSAPKHPSTPVSFNPSKRTAAQSGSPQTPDLSNSRGPSLEASPTAPVTPNTTSMATPPTATTTTTVVHTLATFAKFHAEEILKVVVVALLLQLVCRLLGY